MTEVLSQDEIDALLTAMDDTPGQDVVQEEETDQRLTKKKVKIYDFKRPDKFSKDQIRTLQMMHESFARLTTTALSANLRTLASVHVASVDQLTYEEFIRSIPSPTCLAHINMDPLKGNAVMEIDPSITFTIIDRLFGGPGEMQKMNRELTEIERSVMESIIVRLLGNLRESWSTVIDLRPRLGAIETNPQFAQIVAPSDMVVLVTLETKIGDVEGMTNFCIPYITIEPIISKLSAQFWYSSSRRGATRENLNILKERLAPIMVDVIAQLGSVDITMREVIKLQKGDVIKLDNAKLNSDLVVRIGDRNKFVGRPGLVGKRMAVQISGQLEEVKEDYLDLISEEEDNE